MNPLTHNQSKLNSVEAQQRLTPGVVPVSLCLLLATAIAGCTSPMFARYPVMWTGHPRAEGQAFQQQDPFPDPDIGPELGARPRDFARPRTESRKAAEQRLFQGMPSGPEFVPRGNPRGGLNRPAAVY